MEFSLFMDATVLNLSLDKFLLLKMKPVAAGENGGQHHGKIDADGSLCTNCLEILLWMDIGCVICSFTAHYPASLC